ncbi:IucA/IucC family siderophore biosynthesis protein [Streptomyces sp. NBC_01102]|uniref:IucA/IucC family protein n=1 Tax=Streptomyces sp. NBC_01102 TaxID=2903749 RepID=UPI00386543CC|nr:IucA/IucC family siderophore biosynthesis protein [Streptomyces sp. NBC_01102]
MTATRPRVTGPGTTEPPAADHQLLRVLGALLREDVAGLRTGATLLHRADGPWLRLGTGPGQALLLPVREDGFQSTWAARLPLLRQEPDATDLTTCDAVLAALARLAAPEDAPGYMAFAEECRSDLAARHLHAATRDTVLARLTDSHGPCPAHWHGHTGSLAHDTLAARTDHPVHPVPRGRKGLGERELRAYAPEFHPRFALRWLSLPAGHITPAPATGSGAVSYPCSGVTPSTGSGPEAAGVRLDDGWPTPAELGLPRSHHEGHVLLPVHPLTAAGRLHDALAETGLARHAVLAGRPLLHVVPTLSMRTVALADRPGTHLKLPLATATLGLLNRRTVTPGSLRDGAAGQRLLEGVLHREPRFAGRVLLADETCYAHAGHELLAVLRRTQPPGLDDATVLPLAALLAPAPDGRPVIGHLADRFHGGDQVALADAVLTLLLDWQTTLFGHGIALESHQQNISLVLGGGTDGPRLLLKDNDGPRVHTRRLAEAWGCAEPTADTLGFADRRICVTEDGAVADLFTAITVHLCAGSLAFGLAAHGTAPLDRLLGLVRDRLAEAIDRTAVTRPDAAAVLRARVLDAPELPVKAMVTAGTLLTKARSGAADINKHYTTGPNYLLRKA